MQLLLICAIFGYEINYDGYSEKNHYFQVNTPNADYGFVVSNNLHVYCDMIYYKKSEPK